MLLRDGTPRRCHGTIGAAAWESAPTGYDTLLDGILQLGSGVEDTRDRIGDPDTLPMRVIELADTVTDDRVPNAFMVEYFKVDDPDEQIEQFASAALAAGSGAPPAVDWDSDPPAGADLEPAISSDPDQTYSTPSGDPYLPRMVGGIVDVTVVRAAIDHGWTVGLAGEPGSGKTTLAQVAAPDLLQLTFHGETTVEDIVGRYNPDPTAPSGFAWVDGPLLQAMREGRPFLADELPRAPQEVQAVFLSVCDHRRAYIDTSNPNVGQVDAADGFAVLIAYNPGSGSGSPRPCTTGSRSPSLSPPICRPRRTSGGSRRPSSMPPARSWQRTTSRERRAKSRYGSVAACPAEGPRHRPGTRYRFRGTVVGVGVPGDAPARPCCPGAGKAPQPGFG